MPYMGSRDRSTHRVVFKRFWYCVSLTALLNMGLYLFMACRKIDITTAWVPGKKNQRLGVDIGYGLWVDAENVQHQIRIATCSTWKWSVTHWFGGQNTDGTLPPAPAKVGKVFHLETDQLPIGWGGGGGIQTDRCLKGKLFKCGCLKRRWTSHQTVSWWLRLLELESIFQT